MGHKRLMVMYALGMTTALSLPTISPLFESNTAAWIGSGFAAMIAFGIIFNEYIDELNMKGW